MIIEPSRSLREGGFSLVEMIVVVAIVGVLAAIGMPLAELAHKRAQEEELRRDLRTVRDAIDAYKKAVDEGHVTKKADESGYPPSLDVLVTGVEDAHSPTRAMLYFLRSVPVDPFSSVPGVDPATTWSPRSYESPPDHPSPGKDVYDIHSRSDDVGLNGVPYNRW